MNRPLFWIVVIGTAGIALLFIKNVPAKDPRAEGRQIVEKLAR